MSSKRRRLFNLVTLLVVVTAAPVRAQTNEAELAKELQNPVTDLLSVPLQNNWDFGIGPADAMRYTLNVQPVIPFHLTTDRNLITRTIMPIIHAESPLKGGRDKSRLGDTAQNSILLRFSEIDTDGDKRLSAKELEVATRKSPRVRVLYDALDGDRSNRVSPSELRNPPLGVGLLRIEF